MPKTPRIHIPRPTDPDPENYSLISSSSLTPRPSPSTFKKPFKKPSSLAMRNKARLHLALYALPHSHNTNNNNNDPAETTYHYALLVRPKDVAATLALSGVLTATKYHVKTTIRTNADGAVSNPYIYETHHIHDLSSEQPLLLASIVVGKVFVSPDRIADILRRVPLSSSPASVDDSGGGGGGGGGIKQSRGATKFNDVEWVRLALEALKQAGALADDGLGWEKVFEGSMNYMRRKQKEGRWGSKWKGGNPGAVPTFDLLTGRDVLF